MSKARGGSGRPIRLADSARRRLSRHAVEVFQDLDLRRDPEHTTSPDALRALLEARGLPAYEGALDLEGLAGGTPLPPNKRLGVFASLKALEGGRPLRPEKLPRAGGEVLLPVVAKGYPSVWIGEGGQVYLVDTEAVGVVPVFDGPAQYLEALAIELETEPWPPEPERLQWHHISVAGLVGDAIAEVFYAVPFAPASGAHGPQLRHRPRGPRCGSSRSRGDRSAARPDSSIAREVVRAYEITMRLARPSRADASRIGSVPGATRPWCQISMEPSSGARSAPSACSAAPG